MAAIHLKHQRHGTKVACSEAEAKYDESHGWERYEVAEATSSVVVLLTPKAPYVEAVPVKRKYTRRA
jgi:hypothetical protein